MAGPVVVLRDLQAVRRRNAHVAGAGEQEGLDEMSLTPIEQVMRGGGEVLAGYDRQREPLQPRDGMEVPLDDFADGTHQGLQWVGVHREAGGDPAPEAFGWQHV